MNSFVQWNAFDKIVIQKQRRRAALSRNERVEKRFILRQHNGQRPSAKSTVTPTPATISKGREVYDLLVAAAF